MLLQADPELVRFAQRVLVRTQGAQLALDGKLGPRTRAALERFRRKHRLGPGALLDEKTRRALAAASSAPTAPSAPPSGLGGKLWTFRARTRRTNVALYLPQAALAQPAVDVLVYVHGLLKCGSVTTPGGFITQRPFELGRLVEASGRPVVLVVPEMNWEAPGGASAFDNKHRGFSALAKPQSLNALVAEVLEQLAVQTGSRPALRRLIVAGHSRAYQFLEALVYSRADPEMQAGALAKLSQIWALDTTYGGAVGSWRAWLDANPGLRLRVIYRPKSLTDDPIGAAFYKRRGSRLEVSHSAAEHCDVPRAELPALLQSLESKADGAHELFFEVPPFEQFAELEAPACCSACGAAARSAHARREVFS